MPRRPEQEEIELGNEPGVGVVKDAKLKKLGSEFVSIRDDKAALAVSLREVEVKILDRMAGLGIEHYRFADQEMKIKPGKSHVRAKQVKVDGEQGEETEGPDEE